MTPARRSKEHPAAGSMWLPWSGIVRQEYVPLGRKHEHGFMSSGGESNGR